MLEKQNIKVGEGGEIISAEITTIRKVSAEQFCQIYLQDNSEFYKLSKAESNILAVCWLNSFYYEDKDIKFPGNKIVCDASFKGICSQKTGLADSTIKNGLSTLVKKEMLIKDKDYKMVYYLNPRFFFKGKLSDRTQVIKHYTEYRINE